MLTYSAKRLCIMLVAGNLLFGILQLGEVLTIWQLITRIKWRKHIEQHLVAFRKLLIETLYWVKRQKFTPNLCRRPTLPTIITVQKIHKRQSRIAANIKIVYNLPKKFESSLVYNNKPPAEKLICESFQFGTNK